MRSRAHYKKPDAKSKVPTLIIMCVTLFVILAFGNRISSGIAGIFAPSVPVTDSAAVAVTEDMPPVEDTQSAHVPRNSGAVMAHASKNAAQQILRILSQGR